MAAWIDFIALVGLAMSALALLGAAAATWGVDSRDLGRPISDTTNGGH